MPALSKKQQRFFGIVRAIQKGDLAPTTPETAKAASDMKKSDVKKFASTKHKGLPEKKKLAQSEETELTEYISADLGFRIGKTIKAINTARKVTPYAAAAAGGAALATKKIIDSRKKKKKVTKEENNPRIPRKKGQPANSKKHSDLYTDENPKGTIHGLGFKNVDTAKASVSKIRNSSRSHAHKIQAAVAMEQRAREMGKSSEAAVYRKFINSMKKKTKKMNEAANPAQQAAIAISMKAKGKKPKDFKEDLTYRDFVKKSKDASARMKKDKEKRAEMNAMSAYRDKKEKGIKFYDKKGSGRIKAGKKVYD